MKSRNQFEQFVSGEHGLAERIKVAWHGSYATTDQAQRMARIDWMLVPSIWREIIGLVLCKAFMFHRPPSASRIGGLTQYPEAEMPETPLELTLLLRPAGADRGPTKVSRLLWEPGRGSG